MEQPLAIAHLHPLDVYKFMERLASIPKLYSFSAQATAQSMPTIVQSRDKAQINVLEYAETFFKINFIKDHDSSTANMSACKSGGP